MFYKKLGCPNIYGIYEDMGLITIYHKKMGCEATKPVIGVSDKVKLKPVSLTTETSYKTENLLVAKIVSMIRKYHNHKLQTNMWYHEEEPHNNHETPGRQTKQSNQLSLPHQDDC